MSPQRSLQPHPTPSQQSQGDSDGPELLTQVEVCARLGICDETWMRWRKAGRVPAPVTLPSGRLKWRRDDIDRVTRTTRPEPRRAFFGGARGREARAQQPVAVVAHGARSVVR
jgi:predicted DNA-binding transcriptional regulator AlpA